MLPTQGPLATMTLQLNANLVPDVRNFMVRHGASKLVPLYPDMVRTRQQLGWSDATIAAHLRQQFAGRAARQPYIFPTPEISRTYLLQFPAATAVQVDIKLRELKADAVVEFAEPEHTFSAIQLPNDPYLQSSGSWGQPYQDLWGLYKISAPDAWNTVQGDGILVAVVDTGIDYNHPDIVGNVIKGGDFVDGNNDPIDHFGHGTHVAGTIAAVGNNGIGVIGVAWHANVMAIKGLDDSGFGSDSTLAPAIMYAANNGADIINASWGGQGTSQTIEDAIQFAYGLGVVFVAAAGNSSEDALNFFPANSPEAITVAASDPNDQLASFSDFGSKIDVAAPGVDVLSLQASGTELGPPPPGTTGYVRLNGTSMATPHVAGTAALILARHPGYSVEQVRQVLRSSADAPSGYNLNFGYGRLNASNALTITSPLEAKIQGFQFGAGPLDPITVDGTAQGAGFANYILEFGSGTLPTSWTQFASGSAPVSSGVLGTLDPTVLSQGTYTIRLTAFNMSGGGFVDRSQISLTFVAITSPVPPRSLTFLTSATTFKPGTQIPVQGTAVGPGFKNFVVDWASGANATSGFQTTGITLTGGGTSQIANGQLATWDTSSITQAGYYTIRLTVTDTSLTSQTTTFVYLEPDLISVNWPVFLDQGPFFSSGVLPASLADGTSHLVLGSPNVGTELAALWTFAIDGTTNKIPLQSFGSFHQLAVANLDGKPGDEVVLPDFNVIRVFHPDNSFDTFTPPVSVDLTIDPLLLEDLAGDGQLETVAVGSDYTNNFAYVFAWRPDGTLLNNNFPIQIQDLNPLISWRNHVRVLVGNFDGTANKEIVVQEGLSSTTYTLRLFAHDGTALTWNVPVLTGIPFAMAAADLDHNGKLETILFNNNGSQSAVHVFQPDGTERPGWPVTVNNAPDAQAYFAVGDFNRDGHEEIVFTHETSLYLFNSDGTLFSNAWPLTTGILGYCAAVVGDIDGDGFPEIVIVREDASSFYDAKLLAIRSDGTIARTWQLTGRNGYDQYAYPLPIIGDFNQDGVTDIAVAYEVTGPGALIPGVVTIVTTGAPFSPPNNDWPMSLQNARDTAILTRSNPTALSLALSSGASPSAFGTPLTFTASLTPAGATGLVVFLDNGNAISGSIQVLGGAATFVTSSLGVGTHSITAQYSGDGSFNASTSGAVSQSVTPATLTITASNISRTFGAANPAFTGTISGAVNGDTFTESFSTTATAASPVGGYPIVPNVTGSDLANYTVVPVNGTLTVNPATLTITANSASRTFGTANPAFTGTVSGAVNRDTFTESFSTTATAASPVGGYPIVPNVTGSDLANYTVVPVNGTLTVDPATLTITANSASRTFGTANPAFTGTVSGAVNGDTFTESFSTTATVTSPTGGYPIVPNVTGSDLANYTVVPANGTLTVNQAGSVTTLLTSNSSVNAGTPVTFTATSTSATTGTPTGTVQFVDGSTVLGSGTLNAQGKAAFTTTSLLGGTHNIDVIYGGDTNFTGSTSPAVIENIMDFSDTASPSSATIKAGGSATFTFTVTSLGGFSGTVNFACAGLPAEAQCTFAPPSLTLNSATLTSTLTVSTTAPSAAARLQPTRRGNYPLYASLVGVAAMMCLAIRGKRRRSIKATLLMSVFALCWMVTLVACGGGGGGTTGPPPNPGTPPGTSTITVNASSGTDAHTASVSLTVTN